MNDSFFNREAAAWAFDTVMKMDDDAARAFVTSVTHDVLIEDLNNNRRTVSGLVTRIHKSLVEDAQRLVAKGVIPQALAAEVISKAFGDDEYTRDKNGRFASVESRVRTDKTKRVLPKRQERAKGIPSAKGLARTTQSRGHRLSGAERAAYQQQYLALAEAMDRMTDTGGRNLRMVLEDKATGRRTEAPVKTLSNIQGWNPARQNLVATRYDRPGTAAGNASFDVVSALGSPAAARGAQGAVEGVQRGGSAFANKWTDASRDTTGTNDRTYRRIQAGSELVGQVAPEGSKLAVATKFGEFVGQYGPEAEKVVGPKMRQTAYRYRGTERKPSPELMQMAKDSVRDVERRHIESGTADRTQQYRYGVGQSFSTPEQKQVATSRAAMAYLSRQLPNLRLAEIQRKSGRIPPSRGVIIDAQGNIATEAVGHADDHYLPFNLKNLKGLKGGEYVRTRSKGGLTTEDIYTGLVSGARRVTVVSNSGVFTINFADDFRGARRHNDKAATMVDRYAKTLDAIKSGQIERQPISPEVRAQLLDEVERDYPSSVYSMAEQQQFLKDKIKDYKENPQLTSKELEGVEAQAREAAGDDDRKFRAYRAELMDRALESKRSRFYQLDGEGYSAALEALQEQYPYYIDSVTFMNRTEALNANGERTDAASYRGGERFKGGTDDGYVAPRYNRPEAVLDGYYDPNIAGAGNVKGTGKTEASFTNYQNWEHNPVRRTQRAQAEAAPEGGTPEASVPGKPAAKKTEADVLAQARKEVEVESATKQSMKTMAEAAATGHDLEHYPTLRQARDESFDAVWSDPAKRQNLKSELQGVQRDMANYKGENAQTVHSAAQRLNEMLTNHDLIATTLGGKKFGAEQMGQRSATPYQFDDRPAYSAGATRGQVETEMLRVRDMIKGARLGEGIVGLSDDKLADAAAALGVMSSLEGADPQTAARHVTQVQQALGQPEEWAKAALRDVREPGSGKKYAAAAEGIERLRALKANQIAADGPGDVKVSNYGQGIEQHARSERAPQRPALQIESDPAARREGLSILRNIANSMGDDPRADDYREIASYIANEDYAEARRQAQVLDEDDDVRRGALKMIFPNLDDPFDS